MRARDVKDRLAFETIKETLDSLLEHTELAVVVFAGGEPMGSRKTLLHAIRYCEDRGIATRMVSNAYWAKDLERSVEVLRELRSAGLREINISADGYIAKMLGDIPARTWVDYRGQMAEFDLEPGTYYAISQTPVQRLERASEELAPTTFVPVAKQENLRGRCPHVIRDAALSPGGHLLSCCGFELEGNPILDLGDAKATSALRLIEQANDDGLLAAIAYLFSGASSSKLHRTPRRSAPWVRL